MLIAAKIIEALFGRFLVTITFPAMILAALTFGKVAWEKRDAKLLKEGEKVCDARWEDAVRQQEREAAATRVAAAETVIETERQTSEELRDQLSKLNSEMDGLRAGAGNDGRCLSDGVLDALRKRQGGASQGVGKGRR